MRIDSEKLVQACALDESAENGEEEKNDKDLKEVEECEYI